MQITSLCKWYLSGADPGFCRGGGNPKGKGANLLYGFCCFDLVKVKVADLLKTRSFSTCLFVYRVYSMLCL